MWAKVKECGNAATPLQGEAAGRKHLDVQKMQRASQEAEECRRALRERQIPSYFDSDVYACFLAQHKQVRL